MKTIERNGLTFQSVHSQDPFAPDTGNAVRMVTVALLNIDGDQTPVIREQTGVDIADVDAAAAVLVAAIAEEVGGVTWITRGAVKHQVRATSRRPWSPVVYGNIRRELIARGKPANKAGAIAMKFAKRKGTPHQLMSTFRKDFPK